MKSCEKTSMRKPAKIVVVSQHYPPDRSTTAAIMSAIARHLTTEASVLVLSGTPGPRSPEPASSGEPSVVEIKNRMPGKSALVRRAIAEILFVLRIFLTLLMKLQRGDVALTVTAPFTLPYAVVAAAKLKRARSVLIMHDLFPDVLVMAGLLKPESIVAKAIRAANALMFRALDAVVTIGRDTEQLLLRYRGITPEKIWFIPNWATLAPAVRPIQSDNRYRRRGRTIAAARCGYSFPALGLGNRLRAAGAIAVRSKPCKRHPGRARRGRKSRRVSAGRKRLADSLSKERRRRIGPQPVLQPARGWPGCNHCIRARCRGRADRKGTRVGLGRDARPVRRTCKRHTSGFFSPGSIDGRTGRHNCKGFWSRPGNVRLRRTGSWTFARRETIARYKLIQDESGRRRENRYSSSAVAKPPAIKNRIRIMTDGVMIDPAASAARAMLSANTSPVTRSTVKPLSVAR